MITKIDIKKFGLFSDYLWSQNIGNDSVNEFLKLNIIYGRNYSGKTTLSRIIKCVGDGKLHEKYTDGEFTITNADGSTSSNTNLSSPYRIRVYNTDFVRENLKFLYNEDEDIESFALVGADNNLLQQRIDEITQILGSVDSGVGSLFNEDKDRKALDIAKANLKTKKDALSKKLTDKANVEIKTTPSFVKQGKNYNVSNIQKEIDEIIASSTNFILTEAEKNINRTIINEQEKPDVSEISETKPQFIERLINTREIVEKKISITDTIQELINNAALQSWVEDGRGLHRGQRDKCAFCGGDITDSRWQKIDAHFSKESEELKKQIATEIKSLDDSKSNLVAFLECKNIIKVNFYAGLHAEYDEIKTVWDSAIKTYTDNIDKLLSALKIREAEIFTVQVLEDIEDNSEDVLNIIKQFNELIRKHKDKTLELETDKDNSRTKLRFSEIATFLNAIDYTAKKKEIEEAEAKIAVDTQSLKTLSENNTALDLEKKEKEHAKKDEGTAAIKVNELLSSFFGHDGLMLDPETIHEDGTPKTKFIVKRGGAKAHNLSEGECSLIAFCYFIAKMADELKSVDSDKLLIYIDDPISSLDNNHIFFMFSLIESVICKEKKYGQLFISTHNLDFLKYSKRLTTPATDSTDYFSIIREEKPSNGCRSVLKKMPKHLKENITEYNFLFSEIYKIAKPIGGNRSQCIENTYSLFYNLANNMRRFLECYLAYRLPNNEDPLSNLGLLFENHIPPLINRLINEGSHLTWGDKGTIAVDVPEAENVAKLILKAIKERDVEHFNALCDSTGSDKSIVL